MPPIEKRTERATNSAAAAGRPQRPTQHPKQPSPERATMTPLESTKVTGFGVQATYRMLRAGTIPHIRVGMRFFIPRNALMHWLEEASGEQLLVRSPR